ncbi:CehA/McbA family metallohydrolase [Halopiger xanaduensis]|uniref:PHP domain protein n=1 Tax=Halopiger xanaduensis (strain DSM 18323 / JCM 14033 / SH-6) TaxID=797210 RepID=F8D7C5_HALXS|nr:PHP domain-containing protein [Halopiger xanaduensis]AEH37842.1 PHP domain protein [Halopiger xanaduensis SH-6]
MTRAGAQRTRPCGADSSDGQERVGGVRTGETRAGSKSTPNAKPNSESELESHRTPTATVSLDLHVHTAESYDCDTPLVDVLERAADAGLDGICVTDHDAIEQSLAAATIAPEYGLFAIPGVEVSTRDGHVLALGVETRPEPGRPFSETVTEIRSQGAIAIVPHPFRRSRHGVPADVIEDCDGIEVHNAMCVTGVRNRQAARFAENRGFAGVAGSDAHTARLVGRAVTDVHLESAAVPDGDPTAIDRGRILEAIADGRTTVRGGLASPTSCVRKYAQNVSVKFRTGVRTGIGRLRTGNVE